MFWGQIAIDKQQQNNGIGSILRHRVFETASLVADQIGCHAILLDVISDSGEKIRQKRKI
ncbi:MAG: hypothetical protein CBC12_01675 [Candidatus Puniceispirillum sp. TMED52]|nr:MAG: hypothetical protein CBC12_01675 [Candidatus Puniceispirillum sp. TMED52]